LATPGSVLNEVFYEVDSQAFTGWGPTRHQFWGFTMSLLAAIHGVQDWNVMKRGACKEILRSFAWGNANSEELWESTPRNSGVSFETWSAAKEAGARFDRISHILKILRPRVVIITWKNMNPASYFEGIRFQEVGKEDDVRH